jgi:signal transduction histidine kinase
MQQESQQVARGISRMLQRESSSPGVDDPTVGESGRGGQGASDPVHEVGADLQAVIRDLQEDLRLQRMALEASQALTQQTEVALGHAQSELRLVSAALMTAQEMERKRIASELHDSIGQALNALSFAVGVATDLSSGGDAAGATDMLQRVATQIKDTVEEVRRIAMDLRPAILDDLGIVGTLSWFFREFRAIYPNIDLRTEVDVEESDVAVSLRTPIYRVIQEALNNILKHASASEIRVVLARRPPRMVLEIKDNGRGFAVGEDHLHARTQGAGMGLTGMRDRVEFSGGDFSLGSMPGHGTLVRACWPIGGANNGNAGTRTRKVGEQE